MYGAYCTSSPMIIDKSIKARFYASYRHQNFSLPDSIMHYMAMNPKNAKNPILVISYLCYDKNGWAVSNNGNLKSINLNNISSKLWITRYVDLNPVSAEDKSVTLIIPKIHQCDARWLNITNLNVSFNELMVFNSNVECSRLIHVNVKYENGRNMAFEKFFELFPKIERLYYIPPSNDSAITFNTFTELLKNPQFLKLQRCSLLDTPEDFDIEAFYKYMKKNKDTGFCLSFWDTVSEAYRNRLQDIVSEILESETHEFKPPFFGFSGQDVAMCDKLWNLCRENLF
uniref:Uncharacterized protein n=1 Tax=Panagrolaimus sp. ES5 TaxID=591445 RepID=A0AC34GZK8_9BILA